MVKTKITLNDGTKKKYESDAAFGVAITEVGNEETLTELYVCGNTDAFRACVAATRLIHEIDKLLDADGKFTSAVILGLVVGDYEPEDAD